ncbi:MAG TPA: fused MFS/spermidine synthase [Candidatus Krumholzibacteria bacterium]|nr:fused MFS/spermidine synthase [Candidatus Krumholzibacteria bacterium]
MKRHLPLYTIVFVSGAVVLAIEILGTRVLGPFYGVNLFLWSALITVTLAALSLGYVVGGRWADRNPRFSVLGSTLAIAGLWLLATIWLKRPVLLAMMPLGLRGAVLASAFILFFVPLTLLGMTSPYAIRLRAQSLGEVGRTSGDIYAISTIASVVAALATGFYLIPHLGVNRLIAVSGAALIGAGLLAFRSGGGRATAAGAAMTLLPFLLGAVASASPVARVGEPSGLAYHVQSPYADLRVVDWEDTRLLLVDGGTHTIVDRDTFNSTFPYAMVMDIPKFMFEKPGNAVLVGLGGGSVARNYYRAGWHVDTVEIDPAMPRIAEEYFSCDAESSGVHIMDGRQYFLTTDKTYDLVLMDAFGSSSIPFHLVTREAFGLIKAHMKPDAILAMNIEARTWHDILVHSLAATLKQHFAHVLALPIAEPKNTMGNLILLASDRALDLDEERLGDLYGLLPFPYRHEVGVQQHHAWANRFEPEIAGMPVLTDDRNPVDVWADAINWEARELMHKNDPWKHLEY